MSRTTLVLDGLWFCLCPSFSISALNGARTALGGGSRRFPNRRYSSFGPKTITTPIRRILSKPDADSNELDTSTLREHVSDGERSHSSGPQRPSQQHRNDRPEQQSAGRSIDPATTIASDDAPESLTGQKTQTLESRLQEITVNNPRIQSATQILRILIRDRKIPPETRHYRALVLANSDAMRGSTETVRNLLEEMELNAIPADSGTLHAALQVSAVHPDYIMRQDILRTLRERWLPLSPSGWHFVVAGLLREHQFELALDHLDQMKLKGVPVENWLFNMLIYYLCDFQEFDEVLRLLRSRTDQHLDIRSELSMYVLDEASRALHYETCRFIWRTMVELQYLHPPHDICSKVLAVAARTGDVALGTSVFRFMVDSESPITLANYESMVEAYVVSGDLYAGFEVLCKMHKAGVALERSSTRAVLDALIQRDINPRDAWTMLKKLKATKFEVPLGCAAVILEKCEHEALHNATAVEDGVALYNELYDLCSEKADVSTFNMLISMCRRAKDSDHGMFVVHEMAALGVVPNGSTFEHLIMMCLDAGNFESGYMYFQDLLNRGFSPSEDTRAAIRAVCADSRDPYATQLRYHPRIQDGSVRCLVDEITSVHEYGRRLKEDSTTDVPWRESPRYPTLAWQPSFIRETWSKKTKELYAQARRQASKQARKRKRRAIAIQRGQEEEGWLDYEPGGLIPEDQLLSRGDDSKSD
ncbi:pentatricopeptide repeat protein [Aspergillus saccharolyticus JOP 1030-1]|uniref:Pentatricopeptide repeat protein n=1 Tax=Aspergillus saccharolyticus JOP 1030-1 TaxID=1450539 RepID=A0A319ABE7_9EURO|nr:pentatricopeptide repeat protein [Aspergillus saccharolyticus JOP 1030-1]PYH44252.1 pentatricopeptide repeat protein [Aspergillus saccharolyticus JOP 1030-1]